MLFDPVVLFSSPTYGTSILKKSSEAPGTSFKGF